MKINKYGAIDIGSNAVRLLVSTVTDVDNLVGFPRFKKTSLVRVPIRLGEDVFIKGEISPRNEARIIDTMHAFALLIKSHEIINYRACATSAMRGATNGEAIVKKIIAKTGVNIEIIDGKQEAEYISATGFNESMDSNKNYLFVDVGGGSTEFTLFSKGELVTSKSFPLGTVRILHDLVSKDTWKEAEKWVKKATKGYKDISLIGSGGNINNIYKSSGQKSGKALSKAYLKKYADKLKDMTYEERIIELNLKEDRADVIVPASDIYLSSLTWARSRRIYVPKIGLADGIVRTLYLEDQNKTT